MTFKKWGIPIIAMTGLLLVVAWMAGLFTHKVAPATLQHSASSNLNSFTVSYTTEPVFESIPASIKAREATLVSSQILARIENIHVRAGDKVTQGQLLVSLESNSLKAQLAQASAMVEASQALLTEAKTSFERAQTLQSDGLLSQSELDNTAAYFYRLRSEHMAATQAKQAAQTALDYSKITSPFSGVVVERATEPGNMASPGQLLLSLYDPLTLQIEANVRESLATQLALGRKVSIKVDSLGKNFTATIVEIVPAADPFARAFLIKAGLEFDPNLRPGMFAKMMVENGSTQVLTIPLTYVKSFGQLDIVWLLKNEQLSRRFIRLGKSKGDQIEVISGLIPGDTLVLGEPIGLKQN
ncbi:efflux RND transporter periplasmic adaptor subunit [uncultured Paraglaciecola sp.]|uniref:efflux RND transporter periplasmic adaptor subunit n=1 Tax=uncultured Paraglaciecola sp. TaxID=1765024 RepID=UPI0026381E91|nr:efflux RND transporter periplasmic adaptor subunit [uncultured Paraglaciecola sp.]